VAGALREHPAGEEDELLPHIFMGDLVRAVVACLNTPEGSESVVALLAAFEDACGHDYEIDELIATGFVENFPFPYEDGAEMLTMLGPKLRAEYAILFSGHEIPPASDSAP